MKWRFTHEHGLGLEMGKLLKFTFLFIGCLDWKSTHMAVLLSMTFVSKHLKSNISVCNVGQRRTIENESKKSKRFEAKTTRKAVNDIHISKNFFL